MSFRGRVSRLPLCFLMGTGAVKSCGEHTEFPAASRRGQVPQARSSIGPPYTTACRRIVSVVVSGFRSAVPRRMGARSGLRLTVPGLFCGITKLVAQARQPQSRP